MDNADLLHNLLEVGGVIGLWLRAVGVPVGIEVKVEANVNLPAHFGGGQQVLLVLRERVVPRGNDLRERRYGCRVRVSDLLAAQVWLRGYSELASPVPPRDLGGGGGVP